MGYARPLVRAYWELAIRGYRRKAAYRGATIAGVFTNSVFGLLRGAVMLALMKARGTIGGYDAADALTYVWLGQALIAVVELWGWVELGQRVASGDVAIDLGRPIDFQGHWLAMDLGRAAYQVVYRGLPPVALGLVLFHIRAPGSVEAAAGFAVSIVLGVLISFGLRFLVNLAAFWVLDYRGVTNAAMVLWSLLCGLAVPLSFFPGWSRTVVEALPLAGVMQIPIDVYLGLHRGLDLVAVLAFQLGWAVALLGAGRLALAAGMRKLVVQGG